MTTKFTPGPWSVVEHDHAICVQTESPKKTKFGASRYAVVGGFDCSDQAQLEEARANARLIAAAPDLLRAAIDAEQVIEILWASHHANRADAALAALRSAIAKATGDQL